jgi:DNA-binding helix-hairpin-helix protein with protein kinase domain
MMHPFCRHVQRIDIGSQRTFQQATSEPLGEDWDVELRSLMAVRQKTAAAIKHSQSNADPDVSQVRADLAYIQRITLSLPDEQRDQMAQGIQELRSTAERLAQSANLQPTQQRAGKQERRRNGRPEGERVLSALFLGRSKHRSRAAVVLQQELENCSDPFPKLAKKGKATNKVGIKTRAVVRAHRGGGGGGGQQFSPICMCKSCADAWCGEARQHRRYSHP